MLAFSAAVRGQTFVCNTPTSGAMSEETILSIGDTTLLCVHFLPFKVKIGFNVGVDKFSSLTTRHVYEVMSTKDTDIAIQLSNSNQLSNQIPYIRFSSSQVYPVINILVTLDQGKVVSVTLEDISDACDQPMAAEILNLGNSFAFANTVNNCPVSPCQDAENSVGKCDFKIFVSWIGTDKNGTGLISASERLTNFKNYNMNKIFDNLLNMDTNVKKGTNDAFDPNSIPNDVKDRLK